MDGIVYLIKETRTKFLLRKIPTLLSGSLDGSSGPIVEWAVTEEMAYEFETLAHARRVMRALARHNVTIGKGSGGFELVQKSKELKNYTAVRNHHIGYSVQVMWTNMTEVKAVQRILDEARKQRKPLVDASLTVLTSAPRDANLPVVTSTSGGNIG